MDKEEYGKILECLQGKIDDKKLRKQADTFEIKNRKLYKRKKDGKILRVLRKDETEAVLYMVHNHEMEGHFEIDATYNKKQKDIIEKECMKIQRNMLNFATIVKE